MPYPPPPAKELPVLSSRRPGDRSCTFCRLGSFKCTLFALLCTALHRDVLGERLR